MNETTTITLADGTVINTQTGRPVGLVGHTVVPTNQEAVTEVTRVRRRLADLPDVDSKQLNIVSCVLSYYMFGLDDWEIALALGCTEQQVSNVKMTQAFTDMEAMFRKNLIDGQAGDVRDLIAQHARTAASVMVNELSSENGQNRIVAAKDLLDRAGHRPNDVIEHRHRIDGGLTIEYVKKGGDEGSMPNIDITARDN
jgi:hypothetical protein